MHFLDNYCQKIVKQDLILRFTYKNFKELPKLKKINLNFGCKNFSMHKTATTLLALELLTTKKPTLTIAKKPNVLLKIQKGYPAGCKVTITKKVMYNFLEKLLVEIFPKTKSFKNLEFYVKNNTISLKLTNDDNLTLKELEEQYPLFSNLPNLRLNIKTNLKTSTKKEIIFLMKSFKLYR